MDYKGIFVLKLRKETGFQHFMGSKSQIQVLITGLYMYMYTKSMNFSAQIHIEQKLMGSA